MVRSENNPRSSTGAGAGDRGGEVAVEALGRLVVAIIRGGLRMLWWSILFPMLSVPAAGAGYLGWHAGGRPVWRPQPQGRWQCSDGA